MCIHELVNLDEFTFSGVIMREKHAWSVFLIALYFAGHAHLTVCSLHGNYFVDDYSGIWTKFDGIGAISGGGVCVLFCLVI